MTGVTTDETAQERIAFDPARLTIGIEHAGDPMLEVRRRAYADSFARRHALLARWDRSLE
ncbi:catalase [Burkholderia ubonensis]|uniref:catalase n=1 Tax=Burkholderia ubonensis TaxID=101571 RepID=UPI000AE6F990